MYPTYSKAFLDLKDVFVKKVIQADSFLKVYIETRTSEQTCPCCGCKTKRVHDYRIQEIGDTPFQGKTVILVLRKRRYLCTSSGKRFLDTDKLPEDVFIDEFKGNASTGKYQYILVDPKKTLDSGYSSRPHSAPSG